MSAVPITIQGEEFILLPRSEYDKLRGVPDGSVEARPFMAKGIGNGLHKAREAVGLTQVELAKRLRKSQAFVSGAENGTSRVGERYLKSVLQACGLPEDWKPD